MPRKISILALTILGLHIVEVFIFGKSTAGSLFGNLLQISACALAVAMCIGASRKSGGFARSFWMLVGASLAIWGIAFSALALYGATALAASGMPSPASRRSLSMLIGLCFMAHFYSTTISWLAPAGKLPAREFRTSRPRPLKAVTLAS